MSLNNATLYKLHYSLLKYFFNEELTKRKVMLTKVYRGGGKGVNVLGRLVGTTSLVSLRGGGNVFDWLVETTGLAYFSMKR